MTLEVPNYPDGCSVPAKLVLPTAHPDRVAALYGKSEEYDDRLLRQMRYKAPDSPGYYFQWCKRALLDSVLDNGSVNSSDVFADFSKRPGYTEAETEEALRVVFDYCETGGLNNEGGNLPIEVPIITPSWQQDDFQPPTVA
jgi:hypothetical protein